MLRFSMPRMPRRISMMSRKFLVVIIPGLGPRLVSTALVARVVPSTSSSTSASKSRRLWSKEWAALVTASRSPRSGAWGVVEALNCRRVPRSSSTRQSVKVPPVSMHSLFIPCLLYPINYCYVNAPHIQGQLIVKKDHRHCHSGCGHGPARLSETHRAQSGHHRRSIIRGRSTPVPSPRWIQWLPSVSSDILRRELRKLVRFDRGVVEFNLTWLGAGRIG